MLDNRHRTTRVTLLLTLAMLTISACRSLPALPGRDPTPTPVPSPTTASSPDWQNLEAYRLAMLPAAADDVHRIEHAPLYHIQARLDRSQAIPQIHAVQDTRYTNRTDAALDFIYFRLFPNKPSYGSALTFHRITIDGIEPTIEYQAEKTALGLALSQALEAGQSVDVHMEYDVTVPLDNARGYGTFNFQNGVLLLSNFHPMVAVYDADGWNLSLAPDYGDPIYSETSFYTLELTAPQQDIVITSGSTLGKRENEDGTVTWTCVSGPMRDMMVVVSDRLSCSSTAVGFIRVNSYYLPEHKETGETVLGYVRDGLRAYQQDFSAYPFAELDVVEAPLSAGGMEYPGLIMVAESQYRAGGEYLEFVTAHEVAHQWWYSLVGNDQVNQPWLDESLANYSIVHYYDYVYGRSRSELAFQNYVRSRYQKALDLGRDNVVNQPVSAFTPEDYGYIVYGKGAVFFYELRQRLGDERMLAFLRAYLEDRKYKLSTPEDFLRVAEESTGEELDSFYEQWILSAK